ncbi:hypothetical protein [Catenulispora pinisilvae]|uniref:hypothetical protein n=1 Tax=Catenulispora pinisilvae TaxID=2705253 RepID=UPI001891F52E|nr:hypothetical protein [Catenulispora pinisilvae]
MRTLTIPAPVPGPASARRTLTRISALGLACAAALTLAACSGGGSSKKGSSSTSSAAGSFPGAQSSSSASTQPSFDPAAGPTITPAQLPKNCDGLVTDADMQLALGSPLNGGDYFQPFQPTAAKQLGRVVCQYGVVQDSTGKITSNQVEIQLAIYADAATAQSHGAATVGTLAGQGDQYAPISVAGHPATYVTEAGKDAILVMYDGNRTYLITTQEALIKGDGAKAFTLKIAEAMYKHTTPTPPPTTPSTGAGTPGSNTTPGVPASGAPSAPAGQPSAPAGQSSAPAGQPSAPAGKPSAPPSSAPAD